MNGPRGAPGSSQPSLEPVEWFWGSLGRQRDGMVKISVPKDTVLLVSMDLRETRDSMCVAPCPLTYGPQDSVKDACVLLARGAVLPSNLELAIWEPLDAGGDATPQELGAVRLHVLHNQRRHLL